jgi:thiaminase
MSERFTETLRAASEPGWSRAVGHRFVEELSPERCSIG